MTSAQPVKKVDDAVSPEITGRPEEVSIDKRALRAALLRLDCFLLPVATFIYFLNFLDR